MKANHGDTIKYAHQKAGEEHEQICASQNLILGCEYKVDFFVVGKIDSYVHLIGIPGRFNELMFEKVLI